MTAQSADRGMSFETWGYHNFTLTSGTIAYRGAVAALVLGTGYVRPATGSPVEIAIGRFTKKTDASATWSDWPKWCVRRPCRVVERGFHPFEWSVMSGTWRERAPP